MHTPTVITLTRVYYEARPVGMHGQWRVRMGIGWCFRSGGPREFGFYVGEEAEFEGFDQLDWALAVGVMDRQLIPKLAEAVNSQLGEISSMAGRDLFYEGVKLGLEEHYGDCRFFMAQELATYRGREFGADRSQLGEWHVAIPVMTVKPVPEPWVAAAKKASRRRRQIGE